PSQLSASTVLPPQLPDGCDSADIAVETGEPVPDADQAIVLVNTGSRPCDIDISDSPDADEDLEPSVVLEPGGVAHVLVSEDPECQDPNASTEIELRINGASRLVPLTFTPECGVELWAFFSD
ncbi:MAG TPA: hypothetical protein VMM60_18910, partial [Ilumatobacter sp.]|nr:hypothetical protein [Ilumatobacter sp.]